MSETSITTCLDIQNLPHNLHIHDSCHGELAPSCTTSSEGRQYSCQPSAVKALAKPAPSQARGDTHLAGLSIGLHHLQRGETRVLQACPNKHGMYIPMSIIKPPMEFLQLILGCREVNASSSNLKLDTCEPYIL